MKVSFTIPGNPAGKQRQRNPHKGKGRPYTPDNTVKYENLVKLEYERQCGDAYFEQNVPLDLRIIAYYEIPASTSNKKKQMMRDGKIRPTIKPDYDNVAKIVADGLQKTAFPDDKQIVDGMVRKFYSDRPRVVVTLQEASC